MRRQEVPIGRDIQPIKQYIGQDEVESWWWAKPVHEGEMLRDFDWMRDVLIERSGACWKDIKRLTVMKDPATSSFVFTGHFTA